jgi:myo-inositol-1(or 4)-monophosphatase
VVPTGIGVIVPGAPDAGDLLALARQVAESAGELLVEGRPERALDVATKSTPTDVVTEMDRAAESTIRAGLLRSRPDDGFLGEEGAAITGSSRVRWIVDPIDGTVNYLYGIPVWAVSIAAEVDGEVVAGVVHAAAARETYTARLGGGSYLGGRRLHVNDIADLGQALIGTGFSYASDRRRRQADILQQVLPTVRDIRRPGSASVDLCWVAAGRMDGFYEKGLAAWDMAAGALVAREAGAIVQGLHGRPAGEDLVVAAGPRLFPALHDLLAPLRPDLA